MKQFLLILDAATTYGGSLSMPTFVRSIVGITVGSCVLASPCWGQVAWAWIARYNGGASSFDEPASLAVGGAGNVYVTGTLGAYTTEDYGTVKYDAKGNRIWVARYGAANSLDDARALAVDGAGNVYVTGTSNSDYATIKYDHNGNQLWIARYNGPGNGEDVAQALALDSAGNVCVCGASDGVGTFKDYATVKYDSGGNQLWVSRYDGAKNNDVAKAMAVDESGNVYVTGSTAVSEFTIGGGSYEDYLTVKYDSNGNRSWVARYHERTGSANPAALSVDGVGNVYVTGEAYTAADNYDYVTVKYGSTGNQVWIARYEGSLYHDDSAHALTLDGVGNVYVSGSSERPGIFTNYDYATIKYDSNGGQLWVSRYDGNGDDNPTALAVNRHGDVYVTGFSEGVGGATLKYDSDGNQRWIARYYGPGSGIDYFLALVLDATGNVYVTGPSDAGPPTYDDYATIKYVEAAAGSTGPH